MDATDARIESRETRERYLFERIERCAMKMYVALGNNWEACGKASCARSRRCRGLVCGLPRGGDARRRFEF